MAALLQWFLFVVFVGAAVTKLMGYDRFLRTLAALPWLNAVNARLAARAIPVVELALAVLLLFLPRLGAVAALATLVLFTTVVATELLAGRDFRCGCFGGANAQPAGTSTLIRNAFLGGVAVALVALPPSTEIGATLMGVALGLLFLLLEVGAEAVRLERAQ
jgi:hypothetical protein